MNLLQFTPTVEDEGKFLVCRAENPKLPEAGIEDRWKLQVHCEYQMIVENSDDWLIFETLLRHDTKQSASNIIAQRHLYKKIIGDLIHTHTRAIDKLISLCV